jgi:hypothetical protein
MHTVELATKKQIAQQSIVKATTTRLQAPSTSTGIVRC